MSAVSIKMDDSITPLVRSGPPNYGSTKERQIDKRICSICHEVLQEDQIKRLYDCFDERHAVHPECGKGWKKGCPICRVKLVEASVPLEIAEPDQIAETGWRRTCGKIIRGCTPCCCILGLLLLAAFVACEVKGGCVTTTH